MTKTTSTAETIPPIVLPDDCIGRDLKGWIVLQPELNNWLGALVEEASIGWRKISADASTVVQRLTGAEQSWSNDVELLQILTLKDTVVALFGPMPQIREARSMNGVYVPNPILSAPPLREFFKEAGWRHLAPAEREGVVAQVTGASQAWAGRALKMFVHRSTQLIEGAGTDGKDLRIARLAVNFDFGL